MTRPGMHASRPGRWTKSSSAVGSSHESDGVTKQGFRFYFFSREETRMHVHVHHADGEVKVWLEPVVEVAKNSGLKARQVKIVLRLVQEHQDEIRKAWTTHFQG